MNHSPKNGFSRFPVLWLSVSFAAGIFVDRSFELPPQFTYLSFLIVSLLLFNPRLRLGLRIAPLFFIPLGMFCHQIEEQSLTDDRIKRIYAEGRIGSGEPVEIESVLIGLPEPAYEGLFLRVRIEALRYAGHDRKASGIVRIFAPVSDPSIAAEYAALDLRHGSRLRIACRLEREDKFLNPGVKSRIELLDERGIDATAILKSPLLIEKLGDDSVFQPAAFVYEQRQRLIEAFRSTFSPQTAGVLIASLLGDQHFLDRQTAETFRDGGTFHVLVISGLHVTFIGGLMLWLTGRLTRRRGLQFVISLSLLWAYTLAVGAEVPVVRATVMFTLLVLSRAIYRDGPLLNTLGVCTLVLLVWRPSDLFTVSFQLTFTSVVAIVGCAFPLIEKLREIGRWTPSAETPLPPVCASWLKSVCEQLYWNQKAWEVDNGRQTWTANLYKRPPIQPLARPNLQLIAAYLSEGLLVSLIVQLFMLPLLVVYFHRVSPASVFLNIWVGVFLAIESFAAVIGVGLATLSEWLAGPLIRLAEICNELMLWLPEIANDTTVAGSRLPAYVGAARFVYVAYLVAVVIAAVGLFRWDPFRLGSPVTRSSKFVLASAAAVVAIIGTVIILHPLSSPTPDGQLAVEFLDVGQGDSAFITFPNGRTMLIDGGGSLTFRDDEERFEPDKPRIGESVVSEFLWEKGYSHIDYLVATHADADHIQGLVDVATSFSIGSVVIGRVASGDVDFDSLAAVVEKRGIPMSVVAHRDRWMVDGVSIDFLWPLQSAELGETSNNSSVVMRLSFGDRAFLFTGDIERASESRLIEVDAIQRADVVKVPHHGSRTSSTADFVETVGASYAVISVGRRSRFGHPHREVVERWSHQGGRVMTTGEKGTITFVTDGESLMVKTFIP